MYVIARETYLATLLKEGVISLSEFEKMSKFLKEHFHITNDSVEASGDIEAAITVTAPVPAQVIPQAEPEVAIDPIAPSKPADTTPDFVSLTEAVRTMTDDAPGHVIQSWMRNRNTIEFLGLWETAHNSNFNTSGYAALLERLSAGSFTMTPKQWIDQTNAIGLVSTQGRSGGTYAHPLIACEFMTWFSPAYKLALLEMNSQGDGNE
jgi:hypothetical protein